MDKGSIKIQLRTNGIGHLKIRDRAGSQHREEFRKRDREKRRNCKYHISIKNRFQGVKIKYYLISFVY